MGNQASRIQEGSPLACLLKHWKIFIQKVFSKSNSSFYYTQAWPQYPLGDEERWPEGGSINYNTILQLDMFCKKGGKVDQSSILSIVLFPKRPPRMAKQMQARYPDHGNLLQKAPKLP
jgi:hypothetical protein